MSNDTQWFLLRRRGERAVWRTAEELGWGMHDAERAAEYLHGPDGTGLPLDAYNENEGAGTDGCTLPALDDGEPLVCSTHACFSRVNLTVMRGHQVVELVHRSATRPTSSAEAVYRGYGHHYGVAGDA
jgi:hypothetical protein